MSDAGLREAYLAWTRRAVPLALLPLVFIGLLQWASTASWWSADASSADGMRYLFVGIGAASVMLGRAVRMRETAPPVRPLRAESLAKVSWRLLVYALAPAYLGAGLALMTREVGDYYLMLIVMLVGFSMLYPRFDQWDRWGSPADVAVHAEAGDA